MVINSETINTIKNSACIVCGVGFKMPRAGKLYCSAKCKQFVYYHHDQVIALKEAKKGVSNSILELHLREFEGYNSLIKKLKEFQNLERRKDSSFLSFEMNHHNRFEELDSSLPEYLKKLELRMLSIEEWSFIKILYSHLKKEDFLKFLSSLKEDFFYSLTYFISSNKKEKASPVKIQFNNHLQKIAEGKIKFV